MGCGGKGATLLRRAEGCVVYRAKHINVDRTVRCVSRGIVSVSRNLSSRFTGCEKGVHQRGAMISCWMSRRGTLLRTCCWGVGKERQGILKYCAIAWQWASRKTLRRLVGRMRDHTGRSGTFICASTAACKNLASPMAARLTASALSVTTRLIRHFVLVVAEIVVGGVSEASIARCT
jgi:hypothetical protein